MARRRKETCDERATGKSVLRSSLSLIFAAIFFGPAIAASDLPPEDLARSDLSAADLARVRSVTTAPADFSAPELFERKSGGAATTDKVVNRDSFSQFSANLSFEQQRNFNLGNALFRKNWVSSPASTLASDGLGPLFNARACQTCHLKDGRGNPMEISADASSTFFRLARGPRNELERESIASLSALNFPDPVYGSQLQDRAIPGLKGEARMNVTYAEMPFTLGDGTTVSLRMPTYSLSDLAYGPLDPDTVLSPRIANPMIGMGLLQAIHPADILAKADPDDSDGDGISGKAQIVRDAKTGKPTLGRFGWKAQTPTIRQQTASAFEGDIGISNPDAPRHSGDCTANQKECLAIVNGVQDRLGQTEAPDPVLDLVTFYAENLAVPARRNEGAPDVLKGKELFYASGCASCHTPKFVTSRDAKDKVHAFQLIWPHTDLLLHDMGEDLADGQPVGLANGREWRTPPLWGIGLTKTVSGHSFFLHDGRARNLDEAILWHGGEGQASRDRFASMAKADRAALIAYLESL